MPIHPGNKAYKDRILTAPYEICIERARYYTESYRNTEGEHPAARAAKAFENTVRRMTVRIDDGERIAGNRSSKLVGTIIPVERGDINTVLELDLDLLLNRERQPFRIDPLDREELLNEILPYWRGRTVRARKNRLWKENGVFIRPGLNPLELYRGWKSLDLGRLRKGGELPKWPGVRRVLRSLKELHYNNPAMVMNVFDVQGHLILGLKNILAEGFAGVRERAGERLGRAEQEGDRDGAAFLKGVIICCDAMREFQLRFAAEAERMAALEPDPARKSELLEIARRCGRVPWLPPEDFREAVQALWLTEVGGLVAYGMTGILAIGRFDQYLYPYFERDRAGGSISDSQAVELIEELLIKLASNLQIIPFLAKQTGNELGADSCAPTIGGLTPEGGDGTNALSHLILEAFGNVKSMGNSFTIRLSDRAPDSFWKEALAVFRRTSGAALFNDKMVVKALEGCGCRTGDARDYGVIGCVEPTPDGNTFGCTSGNDISLAAAVEMTLLNGRLRIMGRRVGPPTGDPAGFASFGEFMDAFKRQVDFMIGLVAKAVNLKDRAYMEACLNPYVSATLTGCIENARDMTAGGARYNFGSIGARGFGTAVDSLAAVMSLVYDGGAVTMKELVKALDANFKGHEALRATLQNKAPRYGRGDAEADAIAREVAAHFCKQVASRRTIREGPFRPGFFSYGMHVAEGLFIGAMPNGRKAGEPVSNSFSPSNGSETNGPTAMLQSVARVDHSLISNGCAVNMRMLPAMFEGEENLEKMVALVRGFFAMGGMELSLNAVSTETLKDAQHRPECYRDLVVRVSGYSAHFTDLGRPIQDEIISRTEFRGH